MSTLKTLENGDLTARCEEMSLAEFDDIGKSINTMAFQLQNKIKNEYELSIAQKDLQLKALQSQIQPHFIINTIYSFITLNQIGEKEKLNDAFYAFARLLRYVLGKNNTTTLKEELSFLNSYCSLYQLRFGNKFSFDIKYDEAYKDLIIPKLLLQPLVENAVIHGIEPCEHPCHLLVDIYSYKGDLYITIEDNGVGFSNSQINSDKSIGIKNVESRISIWNSNVHLFIARAEATTIQIILMPGCKPEVINERSDS